MADENINQVLLLADPKINHRIWIGCLRWTPIIKKRYRNISLKHRKQPHAKSERMTYLKATTDRRNVREKNSRLIGTGVLAKSGHNHYFSLALAFCSLVRNGYGVFRYNDDNDFLFLASVDGQPAVMADLSASQDKIAQKVSLFLAMNEEPPEKWLIVSSPEEPASWLSIIEQLSSAEIRRCKLAVGNHSKFALSTVLLLAAAGAAAVLWISQPEPEVGPSAEEIAARARLQFSKPAPPPERPHPWASQPVISDFLKACADLKRPSPVALGGWKLTKGTCTPEAFSLIYERQQGGTIDGFLSRSKEVFNIIPDFNLKDGAELATVTRPLPPLSHRDEIISASSGQLMRVFTWFQKKQIIPTINEIVIPEPLPGNDGEQSPIQKWKEYQFNFSTSVNPDDLFSLFQYDGVRLSNVNFELNDGVINYTAEGHIYVSK